MVLRKKGGAWPGGKLPLLCFALGGKTLWIEFYRMLGEFKSSSRRWALQYIAVLEKGRASDQGFLAFTAGEKTFH